MERTPEEIKKGLECCFSGRIGRCEGCPYRGLSFCNTIMGTNAVSLVRQLEAQVPKWISVDDRLPDRNEKVVVTDGKRTWDYGEFNGLAFCFRGDNPNPRLWNWKKHTVRNVEWWMPKKTALPEPPKDKTE